MLKKKNILVLLLFSIILLAAISSANANEVDTVDDLATDKSSDIVLTDDESKEISTVNDDIDVENEDDDIGKLGVADDEEITGASSAKSFTDLNNLINGNSNSHVYLNSNYTYNSSSDTAYYDGIKINRTVTVHGNNFTVKGSLGSMGFNVSAKNVVFENINFASFGDHGDEDYPYYGSAICSSPSGDTSARNCTFQNCGGSMGGALYYVNAYDCTFTGCIALRAGGAMFWGIAKNCTFSNNRAIGIGSVGGGGALYCTDAINCTFENNVASYGGAMYDGDAENCTFINNKAYFDGGAIQVHYNPHALNCVFINNHADKNGGAMGADGLRYEVINCTFENNSANAYGGGLYYGKALLCIFKNNTDNTTFGNYYNTTIAKLDFGLPTNITVDYPSPIEVPITLSNSSYVFYNPITGMNESYVFENVNIIIKLSKYGENIANYSCLSGSTWVAELEAGTYSATFTVDPLYTTNGSTSVNIFVRGIATNITVSDMDISTGDDEYLVATLKDANNNSLSGFPVKVIFNGTTYNLTTDSKGQFNMSLKDFAPSNYPYYFTFRYMGNNSYENSQAYARVYVNKIVTQLDMDDVTIYYGNSTNFTVKLTNDKGNPMAGLNLSVSLNGTSSIYTTNETGEISFVIPTLSAGTYPIKVDFMETDIHNGTSKTVNLTVKKYQTQINASDLRIVNTHTGELIATLLDEFNNPVEGMQLTLTFNGQDYIKFTDSSGQINLDIPQLNEGDYPVFIGFAENEKYLSTMKEVHVEVSKIATIINASDVRLIYGDDGGKLVITFLNETDEPLIGFNLTIEFNGENITKTTDENGQIIIDIPLLDEGSYPVTITYNGTEIFAPASDSLNITITKVFTSIDASDISIIYGETPSVTFQLLNEFNEKLAGYNLTITLNGNEVNKTTDGNGKVSFDIPVLSANTYPIDISFAGNGYYNGTSKTVNLVVSQLDTAIAASDLTINYGEGQLIATLTNASGDGLIGYDLYLSLLGKNQSAITNGSGHAIFDITDFAGDDADATITFMGTELYKSSSKTVKIHNIRANSMISAENVEYVFRETSTMVAKLTDSEGNGIEGQVLHFSFGDLSQNITTDSEGIAVLNLDETQTVGTHSGSISFDGNARYNPSTLQAKFTVGKIQTKLSASDLTTTYGSDDCLVIKLVDYNDKPLANALIRIKLGTLKEEEVHTNSDGMVYYSIKGKPAMEYTAKIYFDENDIYKGNYTEANVIINKASTVDPEDPGNGTSPSGNGSSGNGSSTGNGSTSGGGSSTVKKYSTKIVTGSFITYYNSGKYIVASLKDTNNNKMVSGAKVSITLNGKKTTLTTDANGQVKLSTKGLVPKSYPVKVVFAGNDNYFASSFSLKVIVKKLTPKFAYSSKKTYKRSVKTKKYTVTLKTNKNKVMKNTKVTLKVRGKTYAVKTNKKGKATFKITNLKKKGRFGALIKFAGNKYYSAIKKTAYIYVK